MFVPLKYHKTQTKPKSVKPSWPKQMHITNEWVDWFSHTLHIYQTWSQQSTSPSQNHVDRNLDKPSFFPALLTVTMWLCSLCQWFSLRWMLILIFAILIVINLLNRKDPPHFPPGPPALPFFGNIFSIESKQPHIYLTKVKKTSKAAEIRKCW